MKKSKDNKKQKIIDIIIIVSAILAFILIVVGLIFIFRKSDTEKIANYISENLKLLVIKEEGKDKQNKYSYIDSIKLYKEENKEEYRIIVAKYNSSSEAKAKEEYLENTYKLFHEKFDRTIMEESEEYTLMLADEQNEIYVYKNYLFNISSSWKKEINKVKKIINEAVDKYGKAKGENIPKKTLEVYWNLELNEFLQSNMTYYQAALDDLKKQIAKFEKDMEGCTGTKCDEYIKEAAKFEKYNDVKIEIENLKSKYNEIINKKNNIINSINNRINNLELTLDKAEFDNIKAEINNLTDTYYDTSKEEWNKRLSGIEEKVFVRSCVSYPYKDVLRNPSDYSGKSAYWFGVITQKVSSYQYRIGVDCTRNRFSESGYVCSNHIYATYYGDTALIEDDVVKVYGSMTGSTTYTSIFGASITIPSISAKYIYIQ